MDDLSFRDFASIKAWQNFSALKYRLLSVKGRYILIGLTIQNSEGKLHLISPTVCDLNALSNDMSLFVNSGFLIYALVSSFLYWIFFTFKTTKRFSKLILLVEIISLTHFYIWNSNILNSLILAPVRLFSLLSSFYFLSFFSKNRSSSINAKVTRK